MNKLSDMLAAALLTTFLLGAATGLGGAVRGVDDWRSDAIPAPLRPPAMRDAATPDAGLPGGAGPA